MPGELEGITLENNKTGYLNQDKSVNIQQHMDRQEKLEKSGLQNIEIRDRAKQLGKDDFLLLLVKQLTHQDPTAPIQDQAFIAQMAQFSSLEQMQNMSQSINKLSDRQALTLVGKFVMGKDFTSGEPVTGVAQALFFDHSGQAFLKVSGKNMAINDIQLVGDPANFKREFGGTAGPTTGAGSEINAPAGRTSSMGPVPEAFANGQTGPGLPDAAADASGGQKGAGNVPVPGAAGGTGLAPAAGSEANPEGAPKPGLEKNVPAATPANTQGPGQAPARNEKPVSFMEMIREGGSVRRFFQA